MRHHIPRELYPRGGLAPCCRDRSSAFPRSVAALPWDARESPLARSCSAGACAPPAETQVTFCEKARARRQDASTQHATRDRSSVGEKKKAHTPPAGGAANARGGGGYFLLVPETSVWSSISALPKSKNSSTVMVPSLLVSITASSLFTCVPGSSLVIHPEPETLYRKTRTIQPG